MANLEEDSDEGLHQAARLIRARLGCDSVLVTRGDRGMMLLEGDGDPVFVQTVAREVYDVTGAGDTVIATLAAALAAGASMLEAATLANHAAGVVVGKVGTATTSADELIATFDDRSGGRCFVLCSLFFIRMVVKHSRLWIMIGKTLHHYRILEKLGVGGQGTVYKATDTKLGRTVVVKVLPPELTAKEANLKRFEREARLASSLDHPNICTIFDLDEVEGVHFIAMQHVEGKNVRQLVGGHPLELKSALLIAIQVADALAVAHARGIIHRDVKSGNVMVTPSGQVKILDFGLAKLLDDDEASATGIHRTELTEVGVPYGTATYAAPEQARGDRVDKRADIFSTGVLLYEMLTGTWPFRGKSTIDVRHAVLYDAPKPLAEMRRDPLPARLQQILDRAMAKDPRDRYQKMEEMRDDLRGVLQEVTNAESGGAPLQTITPEPPRHVAGANPVSRAMRWIRSIGKSEARRQAQVSPRLRSRLFTKLRLRPLPIRRRRVWQSCLSKISATTRLRVFTSFRSPTQ